MKKKANLFLGTRYTERAMYKSMVIFFYVTYNYKVNAEKIVELQSYVNTAYPQTNWQLFALRDCLFFVFNCFVFIKSISKMWAGHKSLLSYCKTGKVRVVLESKKKIFQQGYN